MDLLLFGLGAIGLWLLAFAIFAFLGNLKGFRAADAQITIFESRLITHSGTERLSEGEVFEFSEGPSSAIASSLSAHLRSMKRAASAKALATFNTDAGLRSFAAASMAGVTRIRAISGIVLILGLVITLVNLQGAVASLDRVLQEGRAPTTSGASKALDPEALQTGMRGIAASATQAFRYSAIAIGIAALLLICAMAQTRSAHELNRRLCAATAELMAIAATEEVRTSPDHALANLSEVINNFSEMTRVFEKTNSGLEELASFGSKFESSAELISKAVDGLPKQIQTGMVNLSADVARGINEDLKHQLEYLKRIAAIYGDQQINITQIQKYMDGMAAQVESSSKSIRQLEGTPAAIQALTAVLNQFDSSTGILRTDVQKLNSKVSQFPIEEFSKATLEFKELSATLAPALSELKEAASELDAKVNSTLEQAQNNLTEKTQSSIDHLVIEISRILSNGLSAGLEHSISNIHAEISTIQRMLSSAAGAGAGAGNGNDSAGLVAIQKKLIHISSELDRVPKWRL
ncbi:MAG: hypothetical protein JWO13_1671 [Acidobacteriales bacterium]|nr:hypothetical protein [Terriglobales bacterium]